MSEQIRAPIALTDAQVAQLSDVTDNSAGN